MRGSLDGGSCFWVPFFPSTCNSGVFTLDCVYFGILHWMYGSWSSPKGQLLVWALVSPPGSGIQLVCIWSGAPSLVSSKRNLYCTHQATIRKMVQTEGFMSNVLYFSKAKYFSRYSLLYSKIYLMNSGLPSAFLHHFNKIFPLINTSKFSFLSPSF